jgi:hypothetical protein
MFKIFKFGQNLAALEEGFTYLARWDNAQREFSVKYRKKLPLLFLLEKFNINLS